MKTVAELHDEAMALMDEALGLQRAGGSVNKLFRQATSLEEQAASLVENDFTLEPTRAILHRSAASLAMLSKDWRRAEKLIAAGLRGEPPEEIAEELRDVLETAHAMRHLEVKGVVLSSGELQLAVSGPRIAHGFAPSREVMPRVEATEKILARRAEHRGSKAGVETYLSVPRAASYAVTIKVASQPEQLQLTSKPIGMSEVIREVIDYLELYSDDRIDELRRLIGDEEHLELFLALADKIAPDGRNVRQVGFSLLRDDRSSALRKISIRRKPRTKASRSALNSTQEIEFSGIVKAADDTGKSSTIKVVDDSGAVRMFHVPSLMFMEDIVRPHWGRLVQVRAKQAKKRWILTSICPVDSSR